MLKAAAEIQMLEQNGNYARLLGKMVLPTETAHPGEKNE
jgi:16S rRNA U1498 N3-methylase RsmE